MVVMDLKLDNLCAFRNFDYIKIVGGLDLL